MNSPGVPRPVPPVWWSSKSPAPPRTPLFFYVPVACCLTISRSAVGDSIPGQLSQSACLATQFSKTMRVATRLQSRPHAKYLTCLQRR